jgi:hypothetical protein
LPRLPRAPHYIRATPGESYPSLGKPVSSIAYTSYGVLRRAERDNIAEDLRHHGRDMARPLGHSRTHVITPD